MTCKHSKIELDTELNILFCKKCLRDVYEVEKGRLIRTVYKVKKAV